MATGLYPPLHDRIHARHPHAGKHGLDPGVGEDLVEHGGELRVPVADQVLDGCGCVFQVHGEVLRRLSDPGRGGMRGGTEDANTAGGVFDDGEDVLALPGQRDGLDEVAGEQRFGLGAQEAGPGRDAALGCGVDARGLEDLPDGGGRP